MWEELTEELNVLQLRVWSPLVADGSVEHPLRVRSHHAQSAVHQALVTGTQMAITQTTRGTVHDST